MFTAWPVAMFITIRLFVQSVGTNGKGLVIMAHGINKDMQIQGELIAKMLKENDGKLPTAKLSLSESVKRHAEKTCGRVDFVKTEWGGYFVRE